MILQRVAAWFCFAPLAAVAAGADGHYPITGVPVDPRAGGVPLRRNIDELEAIGGEQWYGNHQLDLFIRSLLAMHDAPASDPFSYFQISGIHGKPFIEWNSGGKKKADGWQGYCPHNEKVFLPWHRTFVLLYEQVLVGHAKRLARDYPHRYRYQYMQAAENLRSPYWDWGLGLGVPQATVPETIRIRIPKGDILEETEVPNPLVTFRFPPEVVEGQYSDFDPANRTQIYRCPSPEKYPDSANKDLSRRPYQSWIYECFTRAANYSDFASTSDRGISLEQIHNGIHWDGACGGQFLATDYSAFDPLFMLHHANVDRLWAYWQAISPDHGIFHEPYVGSSRFSTPNGTTITPDSPLEPFYKSDNDYHSTRSVSRIRDLGYCYFGLEHWEKSDAQMKHAAQGIINRLYGPNATDPEPLIQINKSTTTRFMAHVQLDVAGIDRPCTLEIYLGPRHAGSFVVMAQPEKGMVYGGIPLSKAIGESGMGWMAATSIVQWIQSSLEVSVVKVRFHSDQLPEPGEFDVIDANPAG
uniref:tyrosinase n=1 Tax=Bionectria ochroleuca TaxID=29856 RepID=A0A8H7NEV0_BIOOC